MRIWDCRLRVEKAGNNPSPNPQSAIEMFRILAFIVGLAIAAWGGVIAYRALFIDPSATAVINEGTGVIHQYPNLLLVACGLIMLACGACAAFFALRRKPM